MAVKAAPMAAPAPAFDWTGFYVGANAGGGWSPNSSDPYNGLVWPAFAVFPPQAPVITIFPGQFGTLAGTGGNNSGFIGGGQIGYNWQVRQFVLGLEADAVGTDLHGSSASATRSFGPPGFPILVPVSQTVTVNFGHVDWMASFRGRVGFAADRALFYATGGAAVAGIGATTTTVVNGPGIPEGRSRQQAAARPRAGAGPSAAASNGRSTGTGAWPASIATPTSAHAASIS